MTNRFRLVATAHTVLRVIRGGNLLLLLAFLSMLLLSIVYYSQLADKISLKYPALDSATTVSGLRILVGLGIMWCIANDRLLKALLQLTESARNGDPFVEANVSRLRAIGWSLLAMQILGILVGMAAARFEIGSLADRYSSPSIAGWLSVLIAFVLAEVFAVGSAMREEQEGTV